jgi:hypothetical protein
MIKSALVARVAFALSFACASMLAATAAHAAPAVTPPFDASVCMTPADVTGALVGTGADFYNAAPTCKALCRRAEADCRHYSNSAAACEQAQIGTIAVYARRQCEVANPTDKLARRSCILAVDTTAVNDRLAVRTDRQNAVTTCDTWGMTCENSVGCQ